MAKAGRPPMSDEQVRARIDEYCARYKVTELNQEGFPVFPAGRRETEQHRQWIVLYKLFSRARQRAAPTVRRVSPGSRAGCPVCLQPGTLAGRNHRRCSGAVDLVRELGRDALDRIGQAAFPSAVPER